MKQIQQLIIAFAAVVVLIATKLTTADNVAGMPQASFSSTRRYLIAKITIHNTISKYRAPLANASHSFASSCTQYNIDCYLLPSIAGIESGFGRAVIIGYYNPFGWGGGAIKFNNWDQGIRTVAAAMKKNYVNKGLTTPRRIAPVYAPPSNTWATNVNQFILQFKKEENSVIKRINALDEIGLL